MPLCINEESFQVNAFLLNIGNDINVILGTPWLALKCFTWDFSTIELQYYRNGHSISIAAVQPRRAPATVLALLAPPPITRTRQEQPALPQLQAPSSPPRNITNRASRLGRPDALDNIGTIALVFDNLRRAELQKRELRHLAFAIIQGTAASA